MQRSAMISSTLRAWRAGWFSSGARRTRASCRHATYLGLSRQRRASSLDLAKRRSTAAASLQTPLSLSVLPHGDVHGRAPTQHRFGIATERGFEYGCTRGACSARLEPRTQVARGDHA
jgi:hypothetical protein